MSDLQQKQKYLRENIEIDQYEDFADFFQNQAGEMDINHLSFDYIKQIVNKYKASKEKQEQQQKHERSFAIYQTADIQQAYTIVTAIKNSQNPPENQTHNQKSATDLLDSVFQQSSTNSNINNNSPPHQNNLQKNYRSSNNVSFFENGNIWATTSNIQNSRKSAQFDNFWQLPTSNHNSTAQFKTENPYNQNFNTNNVKNQKIPSFQQLSRNLNMQKKPNPYTVQTQKPSNMKKPESVEIKKVQSTKNSPVTTKKVENNFNTTSNQSISQTKINQTGTNSHQIKLISTKPLKQSKSSNIASAYKMNKIPYQGPVIHKSSFTDTIKCYEAMPRPQLNDKNLSVVIQKHQIVERNFFVSDYVMYFLTVKPWGIVCKRNYEDFTKLKSALEKVYPGIQLPYLQKNSWFETNLQNIKKQKAMLQFFLHDLIQNPEIRNSRIFQDFLTLKEHKAIKRKFEQFAKMDSFKGIQQLCLLGGKVDVVINQNQRIYHEQMSKYLSSMQDLLNRKTKLIDTLGQQFVAINNTLSNLAKLSQSISEQVKKFNQRVSDDEIPNLQNTFNIISKSFEQWANRINFQSKVVTKRLAPFCKYQKDNLSTMKQLLNNQNILYKSYIKRTASQNSTSEIYLSQKLKGVKTGVLQQSKNFTVLKYQLGYLSNMTCKQNARFFELMANSFKQKWIYTAEKYKQRLSKDIQFYNSISSMNI